MIYNTFVYTIADMKFEWDEEKRKTNLEKHSVDFAVAHELWGLPMIVIEDDRQDYGEKRWVGVGLLKERVMVVVFALPRSHLIRIISFRKANQREVRYYEQATS